MKHTILHPKTHKDVTVITARGAEYGENVNTISVIADELNHLVTEFPVCFLKDPNTGQFGLYALTGFDEGENLFLDNDKWLSAYIPIHVLRQPFMLAIQGEEGAQPTTENTVVTIQLDNKRVTDTGGEKLFKDDGEATEFLIQQTNMLATLLQGLTKTQKFTDTLLEKGLLEQLHLTVTLKNGEKKSFQGFYGINKDVLSKLEGESLASFHRHGYLQACHLMLASFGNMQKLVNLKNKMLG